LQNESTVLIDTGVKYSPDEDFNSAQSIQPIEISPALLMHDATSEQPKFRNEF
jgi:hypothetical protein